MLHTLGDFYHRHVYTKITKVTTHITNKTQRPITDLFLFPLLFPELLVGGIACCTYRLATNPEATTSEKFATVSIELLGVPAIITGTYFLNIFRTPLSKKLGLHLPKKIKEEQEMEYLINKLNYYKDSQRLSFEEVDQRINTGIDLFVREYEGYRVPFPQVTKISRFGRYFLRRGVLGLMNPFIQEVIWMSRDRCLDNLAHEKAHTVGYARENEAQFVGYASLLLTKDPSLIYLAYKFRLNLALGYFGIALDDFEHSLHGLNQQTLDEILNEGNEFKKEFNDNSSYRKFILRIGRYCRSFLLKSLGESNVHHAYCDLPLRMIHAYDPPKSLSETLNIS